MKQTEYELEVLAVARKLREGLTKEEKERLEKYGSIEFKSAGARRQK